MELNNLLSRSWWKRKLFGSFANLNYLIGQKGPIWINVDHPWLEYNECTELKTVINRKATMFSNMKLLLVKKGSGEVVQDPELEKLLSQPNCYQGQNDWLKEYMIQKCVYGNQFMYGNRVSTMLKYPASLKNVSPRYLKPVLTGKLFDQEDMQGIIERYDFIQQGFKRSFDTKDILFSRIPDIDNPILGLSPIMGLRKPISNTKLAYDYLNVISGEKGAIGMLSQEKNSDGDGAIPLDPVEKERVEKEIRQDYGVEDGKKRILLTTASLKWTAMSYPTRELLLPEQIDMYMRKIIDEYGLNQNIFSSVNGTTYENLKNGMVQAYQDTIQPEADVFVQALAKFIGVAEGFELKASYEHIAILKENKLKGMEAINSIITSLTDAIQNGLISSDRAIQILATELGIPVEDTHASPVVRALQKLSPLVANNVINQMTVDEVRDLGSLGALGAGKQTIGQQGATVATTPKPAPAK